MSLERPEAGCGGVVIDPPCALTLPAQVALEDYARVLTRARTAETITDTGDEVMVRGVHLCGLPNPIGDPAWRDIVDFARDISVRESSGGLGWS
jgi:hypothetical protein